ncbi:MAG TPA: glycosyltransferase family 4 protein [Candidatus Eisenbacteria bacterium]|nr:glycosyltransferase family 4 protein [Candidatus Eisenbacteria bacterium]
MSRPLRVLAVDHTAGVLPFRRKFAALAALPDIELTVLAPDRWVENYRLVRAAATSEGGYRLEVGRVVWPGYENRGFFVGGLAGAIRRTRPDILHLWEEPYSLIALEALVLRRSLAPRARALFFSSDNLTRDGHYAYRPSLLYAAIERWVHGECEVGTAVSDEVVEVLRAKGYRKPIDVVPHGLDLEDYPEPTSERRAAAREWIGAKGVVVGYAGRLLAMKGVDVLLRAAAILASGAGTASDFTVVIVGDGPERAALESLARELGLADRIRFRPAVPHESMPEVFAAFDVTVIPSLTTRTWKEQFGRVAVEAMAAGSVPVVSDSGALPSVVGDAGIVTPEGDFAALAAALGRLLPSLVEDPIGPRGRERVRQSFTWSAIAAALAVRYRAMLEGPVRA